MLIFVLIPSRVPKYTALLCFRNHLSVERTADFMLIGRYARSPNTRPQPEQNTKFGGLQNNFNVEDLTRLEGRNQKKANTRATKERYAGAHESRAKSRNAVQVLLPGDVVFHQCRSTLRTVTSPAVLPCERPVGEMIATLRGHSISAVFASRCVWTDRFFFAAIIPQLLKNYHISHAQSGV